MRCPLTASQRDAHQPSGPEGRRGSPCFWPFGPLGAGRVSSNVLVPLSGPSLVLFSYLPSPLPPVAPPPTLFLK